MCGGFRVDQSYAAAANFSRRRARTRIVRCESAAVDLEADHGELAVLEAQACAGRDGEVEERFGAAMNVTIVFCSMNSLGPTQQSFQMP
jgi:hypothetical protein